MGSTAKNIAVILILITLVFAGYYMYTQQAGAVLQSDFDDVTLERMLQNTSVFIERRQELDAVVFDETVFVDERFTSLRSYREPITEQPNGRDNPFAPVAR